MFSVFLCAATIFSIFTCWKVGKKRREDKKEDKKKAGMVVLALRDYNIFRNMIVEQMWDPEVNLSRWMEYQKIAEWVDQNLKTRTQKISLPSLKLMVDRIIAGKVANKARPAP